MKFFKALAATDSKSQSQTLSVLAWLTRSRLLQRMLSFTCNYAQCEPEVSSLGSAYKLKLALITGQRQLMRVLESSVCSLLSLCPAQVEMLQGPAVNIWLLCSLLWKSSVALYSRKRGSYARMFCRCGIDHINEKQTQ